MAENIYDKVKTFHPDYTRLQALRQIIEDVRGGTAVLRKKFNTYLPKFESETEISHKRRYNHTPFLNLYNKTEETLTGFVFQDPIELGDDVPAKIKQIAESIDSKGNHLDVFAKERFQKSFDGASCWLVNYPPQINGTASDDATRFPFFVPYDQSDVIMWDEEVNPTTNKSELNLIVLLEEKKKKKNLFEREIVTRYRVFYLDDAGDCNYVLIEESKNKDARSKSSFELIDEGFIFQASTNGIAKPFNEIPFCIVGNLCDAPPLMDIAYKNLEHYETYSDYKSLMHKVCLPLPTSIGKAEISELSSDSLIEVPIGGDFKIVETSGDALTLVRQCLEDVKREIGILGLSAVVDDQTQEANVTATEVLLNSIEDTAFLATRARQMQDALEKGFYFMALYLGEKTGGSITLGTAWTKTQPEAEAQNLMNQSDSNQPNPQGDALIN